MTLSQSSSAERADAPSNAVLADHSAANGPSTPGPTVLVTATHKGAQEDANQDEWRFFLCSFCTNQSFSFVIALRQPLHRQPPLGQDNV